MNIVRRLSLMNFLLHLAFLSPVVVFFFQQRGLNYFQILALESVLVMFMVLFELPTGIFADKLGRKNSIVAGTLFMLTEPIVFLFADNFYWFALAYALAGIGITFHSGSIEAIVYDNINPRDMQKAMGSINSASLIAMVIAPAIGSIIAKDLLMPQFIFLLFITIVMSFCGFVISLSIKDGKPGRENSLELFKQGFKQLKNKSLRHIVLLSIFASPFVFSLNYLYQPYFKQSGVETAVFGVIFSAALLLGAGLQKYAYRIEEMLGMRRAIFWATFIPGMMYLLMAFSFHPAFAVVLFIVLRATLGVQDVLFADYKNVHIPGKSRATVLSIISIFMSLYLMIMRLIIGKLADLDLSYSFLFIGSIIIIASVALKIDERHITT